jgi:hypothetical protein
MDFTLILRLDLEDELRRVNPRRSWRWFGVKVAALLAHPQSLLRAHFMPDKPEGTPS